MSASTMLSQSASLLVLESWCKGRRLGVDVLVPERPVHRVRSRDREALFEIFAEAGKGTFRFRRVCDDLKADLPCDRSFSTDELEKLVVRRRAHEWRFSTTLLPAPHLARPEEQINPLAAAERSGLVRALVESAGVLAALLVLGGVVSWIGGSLSGSKEGAEPALVPAEVARIVLKPVKSASRQGAAAQSGASSGAAGVVRAFRSEEVRRSYSQLVRGGLSPLLKASPWLSGASGRAGAQSVFKSAGAGALPTASIAGMADRLGGTIAGMGGAGGVGSGAGYGKGAGSGVAGQGTGRIELGVGAVRVEEGLTREEVGEVIHRHAAEVRYCYDDALLRNPGAEGRIAMKFVIGADGGVRSAEIRESTVADSRLEGCLHRKLVTWKFPRPKGGIEVPVGYPFVFRNLGKGGGS